MPGAEGGPWQGVRSELLLSRQVSQKLPNSKPVQQQMEFLHRQRLVLGRSMSCAWTAAVQASDTAEEVEG